MEKYDIFHCPKCSFIHSRNTIEESQKVIKEHIDTHEGYIQLPMWYWGAIPYELVLNGQITLP